MNDEIKEILQALKESYDETMPKQEFERSLKYIEDYITNLQAENQELQDSITWWNNRYNALQRNYEELKSELECYENGVYFSSKVDELERENERLKKLLDCKERLTKIMPEDTEFIILTKADYERQEKDIELALIDYKSRCEKADEYIKDIFKDEKWYENYEYNDLENALKNVSNILNGRSDK